MYSNSYEKLLDTDRSDSVSVDKWMSEKPLDADGSGSVSSEEIERWCHMQINWSPKTCLDKNSEEKTKNRVTFNVSGKL